MVHPAKLPEPFLSEFAEASIDPGEADEIEKQRLKNALDLARYNQTLAAKNAGLTLSSFRRRLKKFGIEPHN
jgi:transcriptional regulator with GAF, ATPase, and Fis domain